MRRRPIDTPGSRALAGEPNRTSRRRGGGAVRALVLLAALAAAPILAEDASPLPATGERLVDGHLVRWNVTSPGPLASEALETHGLPSEGHGVLNLVVLRLGDTGDPPRTVEAQVSGQVRNLRGQIQQLDIRPIEANEAVSYLATYPVEDRDQLRFELQVTVPGAAPVEINFERRIPDQP